MVAALRNVHHLGRIGAYAEMAVAAGLVSIHFVNVTGHPPLVAPYRGSHARFGTNPISIGVPGSPRREPFLLDMATSLIALGKVRVALNKGERITPGTLVDADGRPSTDPKVMFPDDEALRGALLPLGLHKGYGLLVAAELLAGVIGGGETSHPGTAGLDTIRNNMLSVVIDPASLAEPEWMERELDTIVDYVTSSPPANPEEPVLVAGDSERITMQERLAEGVPVDPVTWDGILEAGRARGAAAQRSGRARLQHLNSPPGPASNSSETLSPTDEGRAGSRERGRPARIEHRGPTAGCPFPASGQGGRDARVPGGPRTDLAPADFLAMRPSAQSSSGARLNRVIRPGAQSDVILMTPWCVLRYSLRRPSTES